MAVRTKTMEVVVMRTVIAVCVVVLFLGVSSFAIWGASDEKIVVTTDSSPIALIDPAQGSDLLDTQCIINLYDSLVFPTYEGKIDPLLAKSWKVSPDGLEYTFTLHQGVPFHDGSEVTAEDVVFSMERLQTIKKGLSYLFTDVESVRAKGQHEVVFSLKEPFSPFIATLTRMYVVNKDVVMAHIQPGDYGEFGDFGTAWLVGNDAGSGPYKLKELKQYDMVTMEKFPEYFRGFEENTPDEARIIMTSEPFILRSLLTRREIDVTSMYPPLEFFQEMVQYPGIDIVYIPGGSMYYLKINTRKPPTDDVHVRRAINWAFDNESFIKDIYPGSIQGRGPIPAFYPGHNPEVLQYHRDIERAKEELAKSKYSLEELKQMPITIAWVKDTPDREKVALLFQRNMLDIGLQVEISAEPWAHLCEIVASIDTTPHVSTIRSGANYPSPDAFLFSNYHSNAVGTYMSCEWLMDEEVDSLIEEARKTLDYEESLEIYKQVQQRVVDLVPDIFACESVERHLAQDYLDFPPMHDRVIPVMGYSFYFRDWKVDLARKHELLGE